MTNLLHTFLEISLSCSFIIIVIAVINKLTCKNYSSKWKYYLWVILAVRLILPFNLHIIEVPFLYPATHNSILDNVVSNPQNKKDASTQLTSNDVNNDQVINSDSMHTNLSENKMVGKVSVKSKSQETTTQSLTNNNRIDITLIPSILWFFGIVIFLLYHGFTYIIFLKKLHRWKMPVAQEETIKILSDLSTELKLKRAIHVEVCKFVPSPMIVGIIHTKIILPSEDFTTAQMKIILMHELIHYKHHDLYIKFLLLCANAIHWFNPFVYYMVSSLSRDMEMVVDETIVCKQGEEYRRFYSYTILQTITRQSMNKSITFPNYSCQLIWPFKSFWINGGKKQMKHRFSQIMNGSPKKKGSIIFSTLLCLILLTGNLVACSNESTDKNSTLNQSTDTAHIEQNTSTDHYKLTKTNNILLVGTDNTSDNSDNKRADSIILVTIQPELKNITLTSFLRDMYVEIPDENKNKLNAAYMIGGFDLLKRTIETNFNFTIDGTIMVDYKGFENIIDQLGGIKLSLTKEEASYLNNTNFISNPINRTLKAGELNLNGNQALGYARLRNVPTSDGFNNDFGRTARQRNLLLSLYEKCKSSNLTSQLSILDSSLPYVTTDLEKNQIISYLFTVLDTDYTLDSSQIPAVGTYEEDRIDGMSVLVPDIPDNQEKLKSIMEP